MACTGCASRCCFRQWLAPGAQADAVAVLFSMIFGRTELMRSVSKAKFDEEADGEVHLSLNRLKPNQKHKKLFCLTEFLRRFFLASKN